MNIKKLTALLCAVVMVLSLAACGGSGDTYWSKNKGSSMEGALERYTKIGGALFMILALVINLIG